MLWQMLKRQTGLERGQGHQLAGLSALQLKKYDDAITELEAYYAADQSKDRNSILYAIARLTKERQHQ